MKKSKTQKGITLIALIITIVVLLILAVVTINAIQGDGIIRYASNAADDYTAKANEEQEKIDTLLGQIEESINGKYIDLSSEEEVYALSRILALDKTKTNFFGSDYKIEDDLNRFEYPDNIKENSEKIDYLSTASYKLTADLSLTFQRTNNTTFFAGIGSDENPFKGTFNGNGNTITLLSNGKIAINGNMSQQLGFIANADSAKIFNTNIKVENNLLVSRCGNFVGVGSLIGYASNCQVESCNTTISNSTMGFDFKEGETYIGQAYVGGLVGMSKFTTIKDCTVNITDGTIKAKGYDVDTNAMYANFSVGGILGFSKPSSNNEDDDIGKIGNRLLNCKVLSNNTTQRDVIVGSIRTGDEIDVGGLVGCSFNNFVARNCSVEISKGNIIAEKTGTTDTALYGTQAGGIIGRLEHTGELYNCSASGDYLNIISKSSENYSTAGGIVGWDIGPYHRKVISLNKCSFDGSGTSKIVLDITADDSVDDYNAMGGIVGFGNYQIKDCSVKDVTLVNQSTNVRGFVGGICGLYNKKTGWWTSGEFFTPDTPEIINCTTTGIIFDVADNATAREEVGATQ